MQKRHLDPEQYFEELALTSGKYYLPYIETFYKIAPSDKVLEIGCGCGGNLVPFAEIGCKVTGVDITPGRIKEAIDFFAANDLKGTFIEADILDPYSVKGQFDIILIHDVIEHLHDKQGLFRRIDRFIAPSALIFFGFPAWHMPFGGHQQICLSKIASKLPFYHLLPKSIYRAMLKLFGETPERIDELLDIKSCRITVEKFIKLVRKSGYRIINRKLFFINPHYEIKFGIRPRTLTPLIAGIPYLRNFFSTSCFFMLGKSQ